MNSYLNKYIYLLYVRIHGLSVRATAPSCVSGTLTSLFIMAESFSLVSNIVTNTFMAWSENLHETKRNEICTSTKTSAAHAQAQTHAQACTYAWGHTHMHICTQHRPTHKQTQTSTHASTRIHTNKHISAHIYIPFARARMLAMPKHGNEIFASGWHIPDSVLFKPIRKESVGRHSRC